MPVSLKGLLFLATVYVNMFICCSLLVIPCITVLPFSIKLHEFLCQKLLVKYTAFIMVVITEHIFGVKIIVSGDVQERLSDTQPTLIISNHPCKIDMIFIWCYLFKHGSLDRFNSVAKSRFKTVPVLGWAHSLAKNIFVTGNWENDKQIIEDTIRYYRKYAAPVQLTWFPEGHCLTESRKQKDNKYAMDNGLHVYEHIMHPRTKGFIQCFNSLKENYSEFSVYHITVTYIGNITHAGIETIKGGIPSEAHIHCKKVQYSEISSLSDDELKDWVQQTWKAKDSQLKMFHEYNSFLSNTILKDNSKSYAKFILHLTIVFLLYSLAACNITWTVVIAAIYGIMSYLASKYGGWCTLVMKWANKQNTDRYTLHNTEEDQ